MINTNTPIVKVSKVKGRGGDDNRAYSQGEE